MIKRRNFLGKLLCTIPGIGLLSADSFGKEKSAGFSIEKALEIPKGEKSVSASKCRPVPCTREVLAGITWDYTAEDVDPITYIDGKPVKQFMWEAVSGEWVTPDCRVYKITDQEVEFPYIQIHPACIVRCNVKAGWIEYARIMRWNTISGVVKRTQEPYSFSYPRMERDTEERIVLRVGTNFRGLTVNLLDPKGGVITTLKGK